MQGIRPSTRVVLNLHRAARGFARRYRTRLAIALAAWATLAAPPLATAQAAAQIAPGRRGHATSTPRGDERFAGSVRVAQRDTDELPDLSPPEIPGEAAEAGDTQVSNVSAAAQPELPASSELWLISTRNASYRCPPAEPPHLEAWHCDEAEGWQAVSMKSFFAADDPRVPTIFYLHGNQISPGMAFGQATRVFSALNRVVPSDVRFRLVAISWPSTQIRGRIRRDVQVKAYRADVHGYYLAWIVDRMDPDVEVSLAGFSLGARIITSGLHMLGGGTVVGRRLSERVHPDRRPVRAVLMAAAVDVCSLYPGRKYGYAVSQVDVMLNMYNPCDPVLRYYRFMCGLNGPEALGYEGLPGGDWGPIVEMNASRYAGRNHNWQYYAGSTRTLSRILPYLLPMAD